LFNKCDDFYKNPAAIQHQLPELDEKMLLNKTDPRQSLLVFDLEIDRKQISRKPLFSVTWMTWICLWAAAIQNSLTNSLNGGTLKLPAFLLPRNVCISFRDLDVQHSDNYFNLISAAVTTLLAPLPLSISSGVSRKPRHSPRALW